LQTRGIIYPRGQGDWFNNRLSVSKKIEIGQKKIQEIDNKIQELKKVRKFLVDAIKDVENGNC